MKKIFWLSLLLGVTCQLTLAVAPDFSYNYRFTNRAGEPTDGIVVFSAPAASIPIANFNLGCVGWELDYNSEGLSGVSITIQTNSRAFTGGTSYGPGNSWSTFSGTNSAGTLPMTSTSQGTYIGYTYYPYVRVNLSTATGTGSVDVVFKCWKSINYAGATGGGGSSGSSIDKVWLTVANSTVAGSSLSLPTSSAPTPNSNIGSNIVSGYLTFPASSATSGYGQFPITATVPSSLTMELLCRTTDTNTGHAFIYDWYYICSPTTIDGSLSVASTVTTSAVSSSNQTQLATMTLASPSCNANDIFYFRVRRRGDTDTVTAGVDLSSLRIHN